jgi:hypothetical protein
MGHEYAPCDRREREVLSAIVEAKRIADNAVAIGSVTDIARIY